MAPRIVRPRSDSPHLAITLVGTVACAVGGWFLGAWVFRPSTAAVTPDNNTASTEPATPDAPDASTAPVIATPTPDASAPAPTVSVTVNGGILSACGDGEEMELPGGRCDTPAGLESLLRTRVQRVLATCPAAPSAARDPSKALSLGLRIDFARHRVVSLLGRSTTVPDKVSYVPCVNAALTGFDELWRITAAHPRYQYFFTARFSPLRDAGAPVEPLAPAPTEPVEPTAPAPTAPAPTTPAPTPTPDASLPTPAEMLRMPAMGQATVAWSTAIVRDAPRTGAIVARLPQNTAVEMVDRRGSWYGIRWQRTHTGWTYGDAIGQARP